MDMYVCVVTLCMWVCAYSISEGLIFFSQVIDFTH